MVVLRKKYSDTTPEARQELKAQSSLVYLASPSQRGLHVKTCLKINKQNTGNIPLHDTVGQKF